MADKVKYQLEFEVRSSSRILYGLLSTPGGLSEWFCDNVNIKGDLYTFIWDGSEECATLMAIKANEYVKFQWEEDEGENYFFELRIRIDPMTKDVALLITDHAEDDELEEARLLWESQVSKLLMVIGG